jgi:hypothetical protein
MSKTLGHDLGGNEHQKSGRNESNRKGGLSESSRSLSFGPSELQRCALHVRLGQECSARKPSYVDYYTLRFRNDLQQTAAQSVCLTLEESALKRRTCKALCTPLQT